MTSKPKSTFSEANSKFAAGEREALQKPLRILSAWEPWRRSYELQRKTIIEFHRACERILCDTCAVKPLEEKNLSIERNLFSTLFLLAIEALDISGLKLERYAMINHCMRALVTGCDNILDNEYKEVVFLDMDGSGIKLRSVLQIMVADRILNDMVSRELADNTMTLEQAEALSSGVLAVLAPSGIEEHEEESGLIDDVPSKATMLSDILYRKTGVLFEAPIRMVGRLERSDDPKIADMAKALALFGIGCQLLDDIKDVQGDLLTNRYNMLISLAVHGDVQDEKEQALLALRMVHVSRDEASMIVAGLENARKECLALASDHFRHFTTTISRWIPGFGAIQAGELTSLVQSMINSDDRERGQA